MGIFNYVDFKCKCPKCGETVADFQTKDGDLFLDTVNYGEVHNFYSSCDKCRVWIEFNLNPKFITLDMYEASYSKKYGEKSKIFKPEIIK